MSKMSSGCFCVIIFILILVNKISSFPFWVSISLEIRINLFQHFWNTASPLCERWSVVSFFSVLIFIELFKYRSLLIFVAIVSIVRTSCWRMWVITLVFGSINQSDFAISANSGRGVVRNFCMSTCLNLCGRATITLIYFWIVAVQLVLKAYAIV